MLHLITQRLLQEAKRNLATPVWRYRRSPTRWAFACWCTFTACS